MIDNVRKILVSEPQPGLNLPAYEDVTLALWQAASLFSPAELHGHVTGLILQGEQDINRISEQFVAAVDSHHQKLVASYFDDIFQVSNALLESESFSYDLLLPDDDVEISERLQALASWCQGFLTAGSSKLKQSKSLEVKEAIEAIEEIVEIDFNLDSDTPSEQAEQDYVQLVEFLRISVILMFEELRFTAHSALAGATSDFVH
jgi:uncharacterized protein